MPNHAKMTGRPTHYERGDFEILRVNGSLLRLPESRFCYELRFKGKKVQLFEYQDQARSHLDKIVAEYRKIMADRKGEEKSFKDKYKLSSFPEQC
jgi:hypothetical protein